MSITILFVASASDGGFMYDRIDSQASDSCRNSI